MKLAPRTSPLLAALVTTLLFAMATAAPAITDSRAKAISVELHRDGERLALLLQVRNFHSGDGRLVHASHGDFENDVFARRVNGSERHWRIGPKVDGGRELLADLERALEKKGVARLDAGVLASGPTGGKLSHFRIKRFNKPTPALGALPH
jgi:hypothetical protein